MSTISVLYYYEVTRAIDCLDAREAVECIKYINKQRDT